MRVIFMGTPAFAVPSLEALVAAGIELPLVVTRPDKPRGRGQRLQPPPVKERAEALGLPVFQPPTLKEAEAQARLRAVGADAIAVVAFGAILPKAVLEMTPLGAVNVHASLLPRYRGSSPINWVIVNGERETGVTTMFMGEGIDTGDILLQERIPIAPRETAATLHDKLAALGGPLLVRTLEGLARGEITPIPQDESQALYIPKLTREDGRLDWSRPAEELDRRIRGFTPWPGAFTFLRGRRLNVRAAEPRDRRPQQPPGRVEAVEREAVVVACGEGCLALTELQPEGKRPMAAAAFLQGHPLTPGEPLGEAPPEAD
ncbi:MAG: methionyl-tRNA formyltransferase [Nitrospirae bacterium]|nr:MAG: methionyl-tRNA formyltransferase [Nitrospirota bacterium]